MTRQNSVPDNIEQSTALELFEAAPCGYLFTLPDGTIIRVNETFLHWTGYASVDLVGKKRFQDLLSSPAKIFYETHFSPLLRMQGFVKEITVDILRANGSTLPALVNSTVQADASGGQAFIRTTIFDIRERRRYERELLRERRRAEQLAEAVENASDAIVTVTAELMVDTWNRGAQSLFGFSAQEAHARHIEDLIVPRELRNEFESQVSKLKLGQSISHETKCCTREGDLIAASATITPHIDPPGEFMGFSIIMHDIGPRKKAEEAEQTRRDLALANRLAHEINNPLQAAVNCLAILSSEGNSQYVQLAEEQLARVAQVVLDLMKLTHSESGIRANRGAHMDQ